MPDFLKGKEDAITILKQDHDTVDGLFKEFEKAEKLSQKKKIVAAAIKELKIHATTEEELFYPSLRGKQEVEQDLLNEADEEHHVAKLLIAELEQMNGTEDHYDAKFTVLSEAIRHHVKEEEGELFPQARKTDVDFKALGQTLMQRKTQLKRTGIPPCAEEIMIAAHAKGSGDSPAQAAQAKHAKPPIKTSGSSKQASKKTTAAKAKKAPAKKSRK